ncbi:SIP domain-containing protein [Microbacterium sp. KR10-403]|uniref:SIP domain-containing protein n=1 Tax=Microbacterium sp. KR10-403 TaxID=3158581 RepID=UPI0032E4D375
MTVPMTAVAPHYLLVGETSDIPLLRTIVERLPLDAYGQIFVEVIGHGQIQDWDVPENMTLTWLRRDLSSRAYGGVALRGEVASRAVMAWVSEWIPERKSARDLPYILWIGCSANDEVDRLYHHLLHRFERLHLHHPDFG